MRFKTDTLSERVMLLVASVSVCFPLSARSEETAFDYGEIEGLFEPAGVRDGYLSFGLIDVAFGSYSDWKQNFSKKYGLSYLIENRLIMQWGDGTDIYDNELNLIARQDFLGSVPGEFSFNIWGQFANTLGRNTGAEFQSDLGVLSPLNGGNSGPDTSNQILQMFAVEYVSPDERWRVQAGKLALRTLLNLNRYAHGDSETFFSPMLGNNRVVPYTALLGIGVYGQYQTDNWSLSGLVRAPDTDLGLSTDAWRDGDRGYIIEYALTPEIKGVGAGVYRLTWSLDEANASLPRMETWSLSLDQDFGERFGGFFRYAEADNTIRDFERRVAVGFQVKKPFGFEHDRIGVGAWWGDPTDNSLNDERGFEVFYRAQVSPYLQITPNVQFVDDPALSNESSEVIFGLRLRLNL
ncbi:carbohydrate porin [Sulfitobacter sp. JL08]|uniref:carbohydrate porin n=1 Tax=Sulfitobacter sp. JL08 TaxID=2070369 RepID=UPI0013B3F455|nr:carbohydrate porin [Sulfitobacter sp. JL08]